MGQSLSANWENKELTFAYAVANTVREAGKSYENSIYSNDKYQDLIDILCKVSACYIVFP